ncbi:MAG: F0F1 ATP synthase subunit A [Candidatus Kapabacteria bacterium]|nr:F0F1 ATP synthase subunit A [Ignavibacteriota bacterium]MCW5886063.1 F0F1 ATP synthase subunit A [Candidatus Kapabacteria bacterium]
MASNDSIESQLIAKADGYQNIDKSDLQAPAATDHSAHTDGGDRGEIFMQLLGKLSDHDAFYFGAYKVFDLPKIYYDEGLDVYLNTNAAVASGKYTVTEHHGHKQIVKSATGQPPAMDFSITNFVLFQWFAIFICAFIFKIVSNKYKKNPGKAPKGFQNAIETMVLYVRDEIVRPNIPSRKAADFLLPYFLSLFFFILTMNLVGLIPGAHTPTGAIAVTATLALTAFIVINITAMRVSGVGAWFHHLLGGAPWWLAFIMVPIEIIGLLVKPFALTIRLFANMTAGHVILLSLLGVLFFFNSVALSPAITAFSLFIYALELLVAFIQAYLFTILTAIFVGLAIGSHGDHEHAHEHAH